MGRSAGIDILRAVFALWVIYAHVPDWAAYYQSRENVAPFVLETAGFLTRIFQGNGETHPAVLGFIVLSGYCIHRTGFLSGGSLGRYVVRRSFRILPVYFAAIAAGVAGFAITTQVLANPDIEVAGTAELSAGCIAAKALALPTVYQPLHRCAFQGNAPLNTVMTEIALYIVYPMLFLGIRRWFGATGMWSVIAATFGAGFAAVVLNPSLLHWWSSASLPGFLLYWWIGAAAVAGPGKTSGPSFWSAAWLFVLIWIALTAILPSTSAYAGNLGLSQETVLIIAEARKIAFALVIAAFVRWLDQSVLSGNPVSALGEAGYSLYAFHAPLAYTLLALGVPWTAVFAATIIAGLVMFHMFEKPVMQMGQRGAQAGPLVSEKTS